MICVGDGLGGMGEAVGVRAERRGADSAPAGGLHRHRHTTHVNTPNIHYSTSLLFTLDNILIYY